MNSPKLVLKTFLSAYILITLPTYAESLSPEADTNSICSEFVKLYRAGKLEESAKMLQDAIAAENSKKNPYPENLLPLYRNLVTVLRKQDQLEEASQVEYQIKELEYKQIRSRSSYVGQPSYYSAGRIVPRGSNMALTVAPNQKMPPNLPLIRNVPKSSGASLVAPNVSKSDNYLQLLSTKEIWSLQKMPLTVFIKPGNDVPGYREGFENLVKKAFSDWSVASGGKLTFSFVTDEDAAAIECTWGEMSEKPNCGITMVMHDVAQKINKAHVRIFTRDNRTGAFFNEGQIYTTALHECGHALGIHGHSESSADIMFPIAIVSTISERDKKTLNALYSRVEQSNAIPNIPAPTTASKVSLEKVWVPEPISRINSEGLALLQQEQLEESIEKFRDALALAPNFVLAKKNLAIAYCKMGIHHASNPSEALAWFSRSYFVDPNELVLRNIKNSIRYLHMDPNNFEDLNKLANESLKCGDNASAIVELKAALKIKNDPVVAKKLAEVKVPALTDRCSTSYATCDENVRRNNNSSNSSFPPFGKFTRPTPYDDETGAGSIAANYNNIGTDALLNSKFDIAVTNFVAALKTKPDYALAKKNLAAAFNNIGIKSGANAEKALRYFELSIYAYPTAAAYKNISQTIQNLGLDANNFDDRIKLADRALAAGNNPGAIVEFEEALKCKDNEVTRAKLAKIQRTSLTEISFEF